MQHPGSLTPQPVPTPGTPSPGASHALTQSAPHPGGGTLQFCPTTPVPGGPALHPIVAGNRAWGTPIAFSPASCICQRFVEMDASLIARHVQGSQVALRTVGDAIAAYTLVQWQGAAAQLCSSKLESMRRLITGIDDELATTMRMTTIRGQG